MFNLVVGALKLNETAEKVWNVLTIICSFATQQCASSMTASHKSARLKFDDDAKTVWLITLLRWRQLCSWRCRAKSFAPRVFETHSAAHRSDKSGKQPTINYQNYPSSTTKYSSFPKQKFLLTTRLQSTCVKPGFHPNAIACVACVAFGWKPGLTVRLLTHFGFTVLKAVSN